MKRLIPLLVVAALLAGCVTFRTHGVYVNAINDRSVDQPKLYSLESAPDIPLDHLEFKELSGSLRSALARQGFIPASEQPAARVIITVNYVLGPKNTRTETRTERTYAKLEDSQPKSETKPAANGTTPPAPATQSPPQPAVIKPVEERTYTVESTTFPMHLVVSARSQENGTAGPEIWKASAAIDSHTHDIRAVFPILVTAIEPYLGGNTGREIMVDVAEEKDRFWIRTDR